MAFCTECGANVPDNVKFCTVCGKPMGAVARSEPVMAATTVQASGETQAKIIPQGYQAAYSPQEAHPQAALSNGEAEPSRGGKYAVMSTGSYIGHSVLFAVPIVGWIICVITAFAAGNLNKRNYARSVLIFLIIGIVFSVVAYIVFSWVAEAVIQYINEATQAELGDFGGLGDLFDIINGAG